VPPVPGVGVRRQGRRAMGPKQIIRLVNDVAVWSTTIAGRAHLRCVRPGLRVTLRGHHPAADLTRDLHGGHEASGTATMKFAMNGPYHARWTWEHRIREESGGQHLHLRLTVD